MLKVTASFQVTVQENSDSITWQTELKEHCLLEHAVKNVLSSHFIDEVYILTDIPELLEMKTLFGAFVRQISYWHVIDDMNSLDKNCRLLTPSLNVLQMVDQLGELHFFLSWRMPLINTSTIEKMYHALLEDRIAARAVGMYPVDPNLFIEFNRSDGRQDFFPVWSDLGADRQRVQQLYRTYPIVAVHVNRQKEFCPESLGFQLPVEDSLEIQCERDIALGEFYLDRKKGVSEKEHPHSPAR